MVFPFKHQMPRSSRIVFPCDPHHVIQQGHNKQPVFVEEADYIFYLATLAELKLEFDSRIFSFNLMTTNIHGTGRRSNAGSGAVSTFAAGVALGVARESIVCPSFRK